MTMMMEIQSYRGDSEVKWDFFKEWMWDQVFVLTTGQRNGPILWKADCAFFIKPGNNQQKEQH